MKRQIYVPFLLLENGQIPKEAILLSKNTHLGIQIGLEDDITHDKIAVIEIPEINSIKYHKKLKHGFIQSFDYLNEYCILSKNINFYLTSPSGDIDILKPRIKERHILIYRQRLYEKGEYYFTINYEYEENAKTLAEGFFEVI